MAERDLINAFDDCLDQLNNGGTLQACLDAYPQFTAELRPMLQAGLTIKQAGPNPLEVQIAQDRGRARVLQALHQPRTIRRSRWQSAQRFVAMAALLTLILSSFLGGTTLAAESSLPGDPLYGFKRLTENVRLLADAGLTEQFGQRRLDEIRQLQALARAEDVDFSGRVMAMNGPNWQVAGLALTVPADTPGAAAVLLNAEIAVHAHTTPAGELVAQRITIIEQGDTMIPSPTSVPTLAPSSIPTITSMPPTATIQPTFTPAPTSLPAASRCVVAAPEGWSTYTIQAGDTLSNLSAQTGITLESLMTVNCLTEARVIVTGQQIYLPYTPATSQPQTGQSGSGGSSGSSDENHDEDNSGPSENSGPGNADDDDNSGSSSNSGSGSSGSGSGSSGSGSGGDDDDD